jgi:eukaryotic-like serine/threonine-protein kinase
MSPARIAGRYELQEQLGEGGMGVVWRALDTKTGSCVAIKLMKDVSDPIAVELFEKEWRAVAEISHPNIVEVRDVDVIEENKQKKPFSGDGQARIQYELEEQKITRKLITGDATTDQKDAKVSSASATPNIFSVHLRVDGANVRITNDRGESLDDYAASGHDFSNGKIGLKTDSQFKMRSNR